MHFKARSNGSNMLFKHYQTCWSNIIKHVGQTLSNIVRRNMFDPFEQYNQTCWKTLDDVG